MRRPSLIWMTFLCFALLGLGAMAWMTRTVLRLEQAQARATAAAAVEENVRLALWRMDYAISVTIGQENARPYFEYSAVFPAESAYTRMYKELRNGDVLVPSPLMESPASPLIVVHFQIDPQGFFTSPQAPTGEVRKLAETRYTSAEEIAGAARRLAELEKIVDLPRMLALLPPPRDVNAWEGNKIRVTNNGTLNINPPAQQAVSLNTQEFEQQQKATQQQRGQQEFAARANRQTDNFNNEYGGNSANYRMPGVAGSVMKPLWIGQNLLIARRVSINGGEYIQGCWLDWNEVKKAALESAADLNLATDLIPVQDATEEKQPRMLASIPARLAVAESAALNPKPLSLFRNPSPTMVTLMIAWLGVILGAGAIAALLRGVIALSQRRAEFVSAVTHELRTPLTTLRMYTEMLADGMVADPAKQSAYHKTLRAESNRLGHLVDNVLLYSRLERSNRDAKIESARLAEVIERVRPRLVDRAAQAGMSLNVTITDAAREIAVRANMLSVEQILFNLIDNACKYAASSEDRAIDVTFETTGDRASIRIADHGPGLDSTARARIFQPFSKSVTEAANSAPGLGLGLALSRRLAKNMGGDLRLDESACGATFTLTIPKS